MYNLPSPLCFVMSLKFLKKIHSMILYFPPVAKLDIAADSDSEGRGFESLRADHKVEIKKMSPEKTPKCNRMMAMSWIQSLGRYEQWECAEQHYRTVLICTECQTLYRNAHGRTRVREKLYAYALTDLITKKILSSPAKPPDGIWR